MVNSGAQVLLGGGTKFLEQTTIDGETVAAMATGRGYRILDRDTDLSAVTPEWPLLGTFDEETWKSDGEAPTGELAKRPRRAGYIICRITSATLRSPNPCLASPTPTMRERPLWRA